MSRRANRLQGLSVEDQSGRREIPRSDQVKHYAKGQRMMIARLYTSKLLGAVAIIFVAYVCIRAFGAPNIKSGTSDEGRTMFLLTSIAWILVILYFKAATFVGTYRSWWSRVSEKPSANKRSPSRAEELERTG